MNNWFSILSCGAVFPADDSSWNSTISPMMKRKDSRIWQMAHIATKRALADTGLECRSIISATALGALDETKNFLDGIFGDGFGSPRNFIASVHNSMAGKLALDFKIPGPNLTICDGHTATASALTTASVLKDHDFPALLLLIDERISFFETIHSHLSEACKPYIINEWKEAAIALVIDRGHTADLPKIRGFGPVAANDHNRKKSCRIYAEKQIKDFSQCQFLFDESCISYIQPAIELQSLVTANKKTHAIIGSFSPVSRGMGLIEYCYE